MDKGPTTAARHLKLMQKYIDKMPSLSTTVTKVLDVCNQPNCSPNNLNQVIALDPVLTGQVLKLINSAYYSLPNQVPSLIRAIIMLGINTVKNLALSTAILGSIGKNNSFRTGLPMDLFWAHSLAVGVTAKALAARQGVPRMMQEEYFVGGLLHDLGKIPLNNYFTDKYRQTLEQTKRQQSLLHQMEFAILNIDHGMIGKMIAEKWQLNKALIELLAFHHKLKEGHKENMNLLALITLADIYVNLYEIGSGGNSFPDITVIPYITKITGLGWQDVVTLHDTVQQEIEKAQVFLQIAREAP